MQSLRSIRVRPKSDAEVTLEDLGPDGAGTTPLQQKHLLQAASQSSVAYKPWSSDPKIPVGQSLLLHVTCIGGPYVQKLLASAGLALYILLLAVSGFACGYV